MESNLCVCLVVWCVNTGNEINMRWFLPFVFSVAVVGFSPLFFFFPAAGLVTVLNGFRCVLYVVCASALFLCELQPLLELLMRSHKNDE